MSQKQKYTDQVIYQRIELTFRPSDSWESCDQVLTDDQMWELFGSYCEDFDHLERILNDIHFRREFNEHNRKHYWLVSAVV